MKASEFHFNWKKGDIIRHIRTGQPLLVIHVYMGATMVVDLTEKEYLHIPRALLASDYADWTNEKDMEAVEKDDKITEWNYKPTVI